MKGRYTDLLVVQAPFVAANGGMCLYSQDGVSRSANDRVQLRAIFQRLSICNLQLSADTTHSAITRARAHTNTEHTTWASH